MLQEGVAWFGSTAIAVIDVVPSSIMPVGGVAGVDAGGSGAGASGGVGPSGQPADASSGGCGCREAAGGGDPAGGAKGVVFGLVMLAFAMRARRRARAR
jgi:hypothetical protein